MPQILLLTLAGAGLWVGYKWYRQEQKRVQSHLRDAEEQLRRKDREAIPTLRQDPETGIYKPGDT